MKKVNKKILIIGFTKLKYMPYINFYLNKLDIMSADISILYWNRDLKDEVLDKKYRYFEFRAFQEDDVNKVLKIKNFLRFRNFAKGVLNKNDFDYVIVLHTLPGVLLKDILIRKYNNRFILDYRDYTYESFFLFKKYVASLVKYSKYTFVSSDKYRKYLPHKFFDKTITSHNIMEKELIFDLTEFPKIKSKKIRISFWGFIREEDLNIKIIHKLSNDDRFELHFYGREQKIAKNLKEFSNKINSKNVYFHGEYKPEDRYKFSQRTDLIHNIYNSKNSLMSMGNKYYDGLIFKIPQICMLGSFMGEMCKINNLGIEVNPSSDDFTDKIYNYYFSINKKEFIKSCNKELNRIRTDIKKCDDILKELIND